MTIEQVFAELRTVDPKWHVEIGEPGDHSGWIRRDAFCTATDGPFNILLERIGDRLRTRDRLTVAASFALRFGWIASVAIAPFLTRGCVPRIRLSNISLKFREDTLFERTAVHEAVGPFASAPGADSDLLLQELRRELENQAAPVVEALYQWSGFSRKAPGG